MDSYRKGLIDENNICIKEFEYFKKNLINSLYLAGLNRFNSIEIIATNKKGCFNHFNLRKNDPLFLNINLNLEKTKNNVIAKCYINKYKELIDYVDANY